MGWQVWIFNMERTDWSRGPEGKRLFPTALLLFGIRPPAR
jgi:hypothetical protein